MSYTEPHPTPTSPKKTPLWRRGWFIGVVAFIVGFSLGSAGQSPAGSQPPAGTPSPAGSPPPSGTPSPVEAPSSEAPAPEPAAASPAEVVVKDKSEDRAAEKDSIAQAVDAAVKTELGGVKSYQEVCGKVAWACPISEIKSGNVPGNVEVHVQEALTKEQAKQLALYVFNFAGPSVQKLQWVIVQDTSGGARGQMKRADVPLLNR